MCLNLYDYQSKAGSYSYGSTYLKTRVTTNQNHTIDSQKQKRKEFKHNTKENHQITKGKAKRKTLRICLLLQVDSVGLSKVTSLNPLNPQRLISITDGKTIWYLLSHLTKRLARARVDTPSFPVCSISCYFTPLLCLRKGNIVPIFACFMQPRKHTLR